MKTTRPKHLTPVRWTDELLDAAVTGRTVIYEYGKPAPYRLSVSQRQEFEHGKRRGFIEISNRRKDSPLSYAFFRWTEIHRRPFVQVRRKIKFAVVTMDVINLTSDTEATWTDAQAWKICRLFELYSRSPLPYMIGTFTFCDSILIDCADYVASELVIAWDQRVKELAEAERGAVE